MFQDGANPTRALDMAPGPLRILLLMRCLPPVEISSGLRWRLATVGVLLATLAACTTEPYAPTYLDCRCVVEQCSAADCRFELTLDAGCVGELEAAEVLIDGHLEQDYLVPGTTMVPCTRTAPGGTSTITVRGGEWWWPQREKACPPAGGHTHTMIFECEEAEIP